MDIERTIELVGSCSSLVADLVLSAPCGETLTQSEAKMLLATILENTINLDSSSGRVLPKDVEVAKRLALLVGVDFGAGTTALWEEIAEAKADVGALTGDQLLRRDTKWYDVDGLKVAVAAVPGTLASLFGKPDGSDCHVAYCEEHDRDVLIVMSSYNDEVCLKCTPPLFEIVRTAIEVALHTYVLALALWHCTPTFSR
jgi:inorganic pyrophosphatase/exopolyphosphatase